MPEIWRAGGSNTGASAGEARAVEAEGWHGQMFMDSQCLSADPYVQMGVWASATARLKLSTGVTNPFTRNLAVTAGAAASVQAVSGGRAVLGIGRGDSALAWLGRAPVRIAHFEQALRQLQVLLAGGEIPFAEFAGGGDAPSLDAMELGARPDGVRLKWLQDALAGGLPKVPLDAAVTGPRAIALSARIAERVTFSVGAEPARVAWALGTARAARAEAGLDAEDVSYGAQVVVVCHPDRATAMDVALHMAPPLARFQVMQGKAVGGGETARDDSLEQVRTGYDMTRHGGVHQRDRIVGGSLSPEFVDRFAVVGPPTHCFERLGALLALGLDRLVVVGPGFYPPGWGEAADLFAREVLPALTPAAPAFGS